MVIHSSQFRPQAVPVVTSLLPALCRAGGCEWQSCGVTGWWLFGAHRAFHIYCFVPTRERIFLEKYLESGKDEEQIIPCQWMLCLLQTRVTSGRSPCCQPSGIPGWDQLSSVICQGSEDQTPPHLQSWGRVGWITSRARMRNGLCFVLPCTADILI